MNIIPLSNVTSSKKFFLRGFILIYRGGIQMGRMDRQKLILEIEEIRGSKVITYIISTKQGIRTKIDDVIDLREIYDHLITMVEVQ